MQPKQFNMLALAAVISLIAAGVVHSSYNSFNAETVSGQRLFPGLERNADKTAKIAIQKGEAKLTLSKSGDGKVWSIVERSGYPVDAMKVRELVVKLGQAELVERKTSNKELYSQLDLADPTAKGADAKLVRLSDKSDKPIAELIVGKERRAAFGAGKSGTYVRSGDSPQTWLAKLELNAAPDVMEWVEPVFFKIDEQKIDSITVSQGEAIVYKLGRETAKKDEKKGAYTLVDVPDGKTRNAKLELENLVNGIRTLEMTDVRKRSASDAKPAMTADVKMDDGTTYRIGLIQDDAKRWITVDVAATGKGEAAAKSVVEKTKGWAYQIAAWRADQTFKKPEDVFEAAKVEAPKAPGPVNPTPGAAPTSSQPPTAVNDASKVTPPPAQPETTEKEDADAPAAQNVPKQ